MTLASGRYSYAICDRCGTRGRKTEMVKERNPNNGAGYIVVHPQCKFVQPRVVQLRPDPTGLRDARPDVQETFDYRGPYDLVGSWAAWYGLRGYSSTYTGFAVNVRRAADNATLDIAILQSGQLDAGTAFNFGKGAPLYVTRLFDQSGNGNDLIQATNSLQPVLVLNSIGNQPVLSFGADYYLSSASAFVRSQPLGLSAVAVRSGSSAPIIGGTDTGNAALSFAEVPNSVSVGSDATVLASGASDNVWHALNATADETTSILGIDGAIVTGTVGVSGFTSALRVGLFGGRFGEAGIFGSALTIEQIDDLASNQQNFWNI